jgi:hypothetical protein
MINEKKSTQNRKTQLMSHPVDLLVTIERHPVRTGTESGSVGYPDKEDEARERKEWARICQYRASMQAHAEAVTPSPARSEEEAETNLLAELKARRAA